MRGKGKSKTVSQEGPKRQPWSGKCHQDERCEREGRGQDSDQTLGEGDCISPDEEVAGRAGDELRSRNVKFEVFTGRPGDVKPAVGYESALRGRGPTWSVCYIWEPSADRQSESPVTR